MFPVAADTLTCLIQVPSQMLSSVLCRIQHIHLTPFLKSENFKNLTWEFQSEMWAVHPESGKAPKVGGTDPSHGQEACGYRCSERADRERGFMVGVWQGRGCVGLSRHSAECPSQPPAQGVGPFIGGDSR